MSHVALVLGPKNHLESLVLKAFFFKNGMNTANLFCMLYLCLKIPFHPYQPTLAVMTFSSFFFLAKS